LVAAASSSVVIWFHGFRFVFFLGIPLSP